MDLFTTSMVVTSLGSMLFCLLVAWRIFVYNRRYRLPEDKYTKLFGFATKKHFLIIYILMVAANVFFGVWIAFTF